MPRRFGMLQRKLQELESELAAVFRLPPDQTAAAKHMWSFDDVEERFSFLDKLRAAEGGSQQPQNSAQLRVIDERIARLKAAFADWNESRSCFSDDDDDDDAATICSDCTMQAILLDGQKSLEKEEEDAVTIRFEDFSGRKLLEKEEEDAVTIRSDCTKQALLLEDFCLEKDEKEDVPAVVAAPARAWSGVGKYCGAFGGGVIVGAVGVVLNLFYADYLIPDHQAFLIPPT